MERDEVEGIGSADPSCDSNGDTRAVLERHEEPAPTRQ